ncbi:MAG: hypothetical protein JWP46_2931 [Modestobacter sp.]|jgi:hypothetical protein|nr:hypothetical protein [Modestobacter sp.]
MARISGEVTIAGPVEVVFDFVADEQVADGTRMRWMWEMRPTGIATFLGPVVGIIGSRQERACWAGLKRYLEGEQRPE